MNLPVTSHSAATKCADVVFDVRDALGEGPIWDTRTGTLYWVDLLGKKLCRGNPNDGRTSARALTYAAAKVTLCDDDRLLVSFLRAPAFGTFDSDQFTPIDLQGAVIDKQRFNDATCDSRGRLWTATYDGKLTSASGRIVCIDGSTVTRKADGIRMPNGIRFSPDEKTMYFVDSWPGHVWAYAYDVNSATLSKRQLLIDYDGSGVKPDGCAIDTDGCLWIAEVNRSRISRFTPTGLLDRVIEVPTSKPTSVCFGGAANTTLFITTRIDGLSPEQRVSEPHAGAVFAAEVTTPGQIEHRFKTATRCS